MGYDVEYAGKLTPNKPFDPFFIDYINAFRFTAHMKRDNIKIIGCYPDWKELSFNGDLGIEGEYFIGGAHSALFEENSSSSDEFDLSIVDTSVPPATQPGICCGWQIINGTLQWRGFDDDGCAALDWLRYLIDHFFNPEGYKLSGVLEWSGDDTDDRGMIIVSENTISIKREERDLSGIPISFDQKRRSVFNIWRREHKK